jgi:hypothetical protein
MNTVRDIVDSIGRAELMAELRVSSPAVSNWVANNLFPSWTFDSVARLLEQRGADVRRDLFNWSKPDRGAA